MENSADILSRDLTVCEGMHKAHVYKACLPGIIIFVHGVNSDGEWYEQTEEGLIEGLNKRLGLNGSQDFAWPLQKATYEPEILAGGKLNDTLDGKNFVKDAERSPIIRFRWGYKLAGKPKSDTNAIDEEKLYKQTGFIWLNEMDAWGGGPFQNGTSALPYMWGVGMDDRVFWWLYLNMFPVDGREVYACPPRAYYAHASHRLKELIKAIRKKQADCPITVICHSQGNMITLGAAMLGLKEDESFIADTYIMSNPPYNLESPATEEFVVAKQPGGFGEFGHVTATARKDTFKRFLDGVAKRAGKGQSLEEINRIMGCKDVESQTPLFQMEEFPDKDAARRKPEVGKDRDNRGKVFLYCNPHDQLIGVTPIQGIGWKGLRDEDIDAVKGDGKIYQRVWAQAGGNQSPPFAVGCEAWQRYHYIKHNHDPNQFWNPKPPNMRYVLSLNHNQGFVSRILTVLSSIFIWPASRLIDIPINTPPEKNREVPITAPVLPKPVTPHSLRYGDKSAQFDEGKDPVPNALDPANREKWQDILPENLEQEALPKGNSETEKQWEFETRARLEAAKRRGEIGDTPEDERAMMKRYLSENPNATDHGTILTNPEHSAEVVAYDVAVGFVDPCKITAEDMSQFRRFAHWMYLEEAKLDTEGFKDYWARGLFKESQVQSIYNHAHMVANTDISNERKQNFFGLLR